MKEILDDIDRWRARGEQVAIATVVRTLGSSPRQVGAKMAVSSGGSMAGSVSGGCVEGAVFDECQRAMQTGQARLLRFGVADEAAWEVGLACGGTIEVFVENLQSAMPELYTILREAIRASRPLAMATLLAAPPESALVSGAKLLVWPDGGAQGSLGAAGIDEQARAAALPLLARGESRVIELAVAPVAAGQALVFVEAFVPPPTLFIVGAVHIAAALVSLARVLGFRTAVIDPRSAFAAAERFGHADELITAWPDEALAGRLTAGSSVAVLTHDPKLDDPALQVALPSPARYVGALGSLPTHAKRLERLRAGGLAEEQLARLHAPIGLRIGARTPEEIALSIMAEIIQARRSA